MLPECLGKEFYAKKMFPCPIKVHGFDSTKELEKQLNAAANATYFTQGNGPNYSVRIGSVSQDAKHVQENLVAAFGKIVAYTTCWDEKITFENVTQASVRVSGTETVDLPFYSHLSAADLAAYQASKK